MSVAPLPSVAVKVPSIGSYVTPVAVSTMLLPSWTNCWLTMLALEMPCSLRYWPSSPVGICSAAISSGRSLMAPALSAGMPSYSLTFVPVTTTFDGSASSRPSFVPTWNGASGDAWSWTTRNSPSEPSNTDAR